MLTLAVDTSFAPVALALARDGQVLGEVLTQAASTHSQRLLPALEFLLEQCQVDRRELDGLAVALGPGFFTGLRIGLATVQGMALGLALGQGVPVAGVSSLRLLAQGCLPGLAEGSTVWAVADARRGLVYAAPFAVEGGRLVRHDEDAALSPARLAERLARPALLVGAGARLHADALLRPGQDHGLELAPAWADTPRPGLLALIGQERLQDGQGLSPEQIKPRYCRPCDAEVRFGLPLDEYRLFE
jgi:tRNA threonylcarbamoyladenosine biosynthesis protein TsaB